MADAPQIPRGGVDLRKYAALLLALALARGQLLEALALAEKLDDAEPLHDIKRILDITALSRVAEVLDCSENDLAIDWDEYLTESEVNRIKGW
jgi:hypothetical protein